MCADITTGYISKTGNAGSNSTRKISNITTTVINYFLAYMYVLIRHEKLLFCLHYFKCEF